MWLGVFAAVTGQNKTMLCDSTEPLQYWVDACDSKTPTFQGLQAEIRVHCQSTDLYPDWWDAYWFVSIGEELNWSLLGVL